MRLFIAAALALALSGNAYAQPTSSGTPVTLNALATLVAPKINTGSINFANANLSAALVTPTGGSQQTMANALAAAGCTTNCTFSTLGVTGNQTVNGTLSVGATGSGTGSIRSNGTGAMFVAPGGALLRLTDNAFNAYMDIDSANNWIKTYKPLLINASGVIANGYTPVFRENIAFTGSDTSGTNSSMNLLQSSSENIANPAGVNFLNITHNFGGAALTGPRNSVLIQANLNATTGNTTSGTNFNPLAVYANAQVNDNGTATTVSGAKGAVFGLNTVSHLGPLATYFAGLVGYELDVFAEPGSSVLDKLGLSIVQVDGDTVHGTRTDSALVIGSQFLPGAGVPGWNVGINIGSLSSHWPIAASGTLIQAQTASIDAAGSMVAAHGLDFSQVTFSNDSLALPGMTVSPSGAVSAAGYKVGSTAGVSCAPGSVSLSTFTVTNGIVTHC